MRFLACSRQSKHWRKTRFPTDAESSMARKASGVSALATTALDGVCTVNDRR